MTFEEILGDLKKKIYRPVYFLQGEEPYYIDELINYIEKNVLSDGEKEFNQTILYGKETDILTLISYARRYPMMSSHQVIIVKEAQDMKSLFQKQKDDRDLFAEYLSKPTESTLLVFGYKYNKIDKRTKVAKLIEKQSVFFDSKKIYDDKLPAWIENYARQNQMKINSKAVQMLAEYLGNDLSKVANEVDKLKLNLKKGEEVTTSMVEENIGISKEFNIFELQKALGAKNVYKAFQIADYLSSNPKTNPIVMLIPQLYSYFLKVLTYHNLADKSKNNAASVLGINPFFINDYASAAKEYSLSNCMRNIGYIRECDLRSKGVDSGNISDKDLLKELIYKILN
jgi:DNA polymerase-3 subunit delta